MRIKYPARKCDSPCLLATIVYLIDTVRPRHFVESAENAGVPGDVVREQLKDLADMVPRAIESVIKSLPSGFPRDISTSIARGVEQRLTLA
jgi:serine/threonine-protein kinase HipA